MARVLDSVTLPIKKNGTKTNQNYVNNPKSTAGQFSTSTAYAVGQYVYYDKKLYRFTTAHAAGAWNASHVTEVTVTSELTSLKAETNDLKQDLTAVDDAFDTEEHKSANLLNPDEIEAGYYWTDGYHSSSSYVYTGLIELEEGKTYTMQTGVSGVAQNRSITNARFAVYYGADGTTVIGSGTYVSNISLQSGAKYFRGSYNYTSVQACIETKPAIVEGTTILDYVPYFEPYSTRILKAECNNDPHIQSIVNQTIENADGKLIFMATSDSLAANTNLICCDSCCNKKNEYIELTANFTTFDELTISHGKTSYGGGFVTITASKIQCYNYNGTLIEEFEHGLTLSDFINVIIYTKNTAECRSSITIMTSGGDYTVTTSRYYSSRAAVLCNATFAMTNVKMQYVVNDGKEAVWVFGDSYISLGDPNRWATQLVQDGHKSLLLCGYGGAKSENMIIDFRLMLSLMKPKYVCWFLGMNDGDSSSAVNADWKTYVDEVLQTCEENGITPILATIPNCPTVANTFKNAYVQSLDVRYVDFAKAVNAESAGATWYAGMLSSDNTHPTSLGAKALMRQFLSDVPEVLYEETNI